MTRIWLFSMKTSKGGLFSSRKLEALPPAEKSYQATQGCRDLCKYMRADDDESDENENQEMCYCAAIGVRIKAKTNCPIHENEAEFIAKLRETSAIRQEESAKIHQQKIAQGEKRIKELDSLVKRIYVRAHIYTT